MSKTQYRVYEIDPYKPEEREELSRLEQHPDKDQNVFVALSVPADITDDTIQRFFWLNHRLFSYGNIVNMKAFDSVFDFWNHMNTTYNPTLNLTTEQINWNSQELKTAGPPTAQQILENDMFFAMIKSTKEGQKIYEQIMKDNEKIRSRKPPKENT